MPLPLESVTTASPTRRGFSRAFQCLLVIAFLHHAIFACSVPVFRYGLEHWKADPYQVIITPMPATGSVEEQWVTKLRDARGTANIVLGFDKPTPGADAAAKGTPSPPQLALITPRNPASPEQVIWRGPLNADNVARLLDSPARKAIATRLGEGESCVWVFLESGDKAADDAAASLLEARLNYLATVMELPKLDEQDVRNGLVSVPSDGLQLSFSMLRVSRTDPAEEIFVQMLLATEPDLQDAKGPMAFPVFGQGRALYALVDKGIKHETIDEAASFLVGSCSCQVKEKNPGADLLMAVDWKGLVRDQSIGLADLPPASEIVGGKPETVIISSPVQNPPPSEPSRVVTSPSSVVLLTSASMLAILAAGIAIWRGKRR